MRPELQPKLKSNRNPIETEMETEFDTGIEVELETELETEVKTIILADNASRRTVRSGARQTAKPSQNTKNAKHRDRYRYRILLVYGRISVEI